MSAVGAEPLDASPLTDVEEAVAVLRAGGLVAFPTETVWGLAAVARDPGAVERLVAWKGREEGQPLSLLVPDLDAAAEWVAEVPETARRLADALWPGPLTLVLRGAARFAPGFARFAPGFARFAPGFARFAPGVASPDGALGFRSSPHPTARALARAVLAAGLGPVTATSLNRSGAAPALTHAEAAALCAGPDAPALLGGASDAGGGAPSTVVSCTDGVRILRVGAIAEGRVLALAGAAEAR